MIILTKLWANINGGNILICDTINKAIEEKTIVKILDDI